MTHDEIKAELKRRRTEPIQWGELSDLMGADLWYRMAAYNNAHGLPMPADEFRPKLVDAPGGVQ
jgi:hypothetical protein